RQLFSLEDFLFGDPLLLRGEDVLWLAALVVLVGLSLALVYNPLLLAGFSPSLALSRRAPARLASYLFVVLLALVVNLCVRTVGAWLTTARPAPPAAPACNVSRNLRQVFWLTIALALLACLLGQGIAWEAEARFGTRLGIPGTVILVSVGLFVASALLGS